MPKEFIWPAEGGGGSGSVVGPSSSVDNSVPRFDGTTGQLIQGSQVIVDDSGNVTTPGTVDGRDVSADGAALDSHVASTVAHGATGAVVGTTNTQTLTNKTLTAPVINAPTGITKSDVGLANVDNTSDANKPVSTAQAAADAADRAFSIQRANHTGTQLASTISDFNTAATAAGTDVNTANTLVKRNANKGFAVSYTDLDPTAGDPAYSEGRLFYDNVAKTLAYYNDSSNVKLNIGQESYIRVANVTGSIIPNGTAVYITGSSAGLVTVAPAQANAIGTARAIGVTTEALAATTGVGYVTSYGVVNGLNTAAFTAGNRLFLSETTPGAFTNVAPTGTNYSTPIGFVQNVNAVTGSIFVDGGVKGQIGRGTANQLRGVNAAATEEENKTLQGTANEVSVTHGVGTITLGLPGTVQVAKGGTGVTTDLAATQKYGGYVRSVVTTTVALAVNGTWYIANTTSSAFSITLPTGAVGDRIKISDAKGTWNVNNLTVVPATGQSVNSQAVNVTFVLNLKNSWVELVYDGATWSVLTVAATQGGSGSGEKNYAAAAANTNTNWSSSGAGMLVATESNVANIPDNVTQSTAIRFTRVSGADYGFTRFTLDKVDYNKKLKIQFDLASAAVSGDYSVQVYSNTLANYTGTSTQLAVSPSASIPGAVTGQVQYSFDTPGATAPYIEIRIVAVAGTTPIYLNNFLVGPGVIGQVPAITSDQLYTPAVTGFGTVVTQGFYWRRVGDKLHVSGRFLSGTPSATTASIPFPPNLTAAVQGYTNLYMVGKWASSNPNAGEVKQGVLQVTNGGTAITFGVDDRTSAATAPTVQAGNNIQVVSGTTVYIDGEAIIPIAEWAGSGTLNSGAGAQVEYAYNTSTSDSNDTISFGSGSGGKQMSGALTATRTKVVRFSAPIQTDDLVYLEFSNAPTGPWVGTNVSVQAGNEVQDFTSQNASTYGARLAHDVADAATDIRVQFGQYRNASGATFSAAGDAWSSTFYWRVRKVKASSPVGFGLATATDSGLVSREESGTFTATFSGPFSVNQAVSVTYHRVGKTVTLGFTSVNVAASASASSAASAAAATIPTTLRPSMSCSQAFSRILSGGGFVSPQGLMDIGTDGSIVIRKSPDASNWATTSTNGWNPGFVTYLVS